MSNFIFDLVNKYWTEENKKKLVDKLQEVIEKEVKKQIEKYMEDHK